MWYMYLNLMITIFWNYYDMNSIFLGTIITRYSTDMPFKFPTSLSTIMPWLCYGIHYNTCHILSCIFLQTFIFLNKCFHRLFKRALMLFFSNLVLSNKVKCCAMIPLSTWSMLNVTLETTMMVTNNLISI